MPKVLDSWSRRTDRAIEDALERLIELADQSVDASKEQESQQQDTDDGAGDEQNPRPEQELSRGMWVGPNAVQALATQNDS